MLKVNEIWRTINGEGFFTGTVVKFIRLSGCNLNCWFCNTKYAWNGGTFMAEEEILLRLNEVGRSDFVLISGGEPFIQDISRLLAMLKKEKYFVIVETNGSIEVNKNWDYIDWLIVSPKTPEFIQSCGHELRLLYRDQDVREYERPIHFKIHYLQPLDAKGSEIKRCIEMVKRHPVWRLGFPSQCFWEGK